MQVNMTVKLVWTYHLRVASTVLITAELVIMGKKGGWQLVLPCLKNREKPLPIDLDKHVRSYVAL